MIEISVDTQNDLTIHHVIGDTTLDDLLQGVKAFYSKTPTKYLLWDFREAKLVKWSADTIDQLAAEVTKVSVPREGGKTAFVFSGPGDYGLGRLYESMADLRDVKIELRCFINIDEAYQWLLVRPYHLPV